MNQKEFNKKADSLLVEVSKALANQWVIVQEFTLEELEAVLGMAAILLKTFPYQTKEEYLNHINKTMCTLKEEELIDSGTLISGRLH